MNISNKILSDITVHMKYAKYIPEFNRRETWEELVTRNKNMHIKRYPTLKDEIEDVYKMVYDKKILPYFMDNKKSYGNLDEFIVPLSFINKMSGFIFPN